MKINDVIEAMPAKYSLVDLTLFAFAFLERVK